MSTTPTPSGTRTNGHRESLLEGAIQCLGEKGYARTTARDLVAASGTNLASIGYHYGSKEQLLNEALHIAFERWFGPLITMAEESSGDPWSTLRDGADELLGSLEENRGLIRALFEALAQVERSPQLRERLADSYEEFREALSDVITEMLGLSAADAPHARVLASLLIAVFDGLLVQWLLDEGSTPDAEEAVDAVTSLLRVQIAPLVRGLVRARLGRRSQ